MQTVKILGTEYEVIRRDSENDPKLKDNYGYTEQYSKKIVVDKLDAERKDPQSIENFEEFEKKIFRHEIIHAFFGESGLRAHSEYAENEELVDWIAIQLPKIVNACKELDVL